MACVDAVVAAASTGGSLPQGVPTGFSLARPPGHHSGAASASGFCMLNNVAIAARHAQQRHGLDKARLLPWGASLQITPILSAGGLECMSPVRPTCMTIDTALTAHCR